MDTSKRNRLIADLSFEPPPQIVPIDRFFDGNDDLGSIGCNLQDHPGIDTFREILAGLTKRDDVEAVYAQISELDPGEGCWPFTDTIYIAGTISPNELQEILAPLQPDQIGPGEEFGIPEGISGKHTGPLLAAWWD